MAEGVVGGADIHYVIRLGPDLRTRQFLLFRDLDEPDLWLATDGRGRWGEVNGALRDDLDGCWDIDLGCSPSTNSIPVWSLGLDVGDAAEIAVAEIDVETLGITVSTRVYTRVAERRWRVLLPDSSSEIDFDVDTDGLVLDRPGSFRRVMPA